MCRSVYLSVYVSACLSSNLAVCAWKSASGCVCLSRSLSLSLSLCICPSVFCLSWSVFIHTDLPLSLHLCSYVLWCVHAYARMHRAISVCVHLQIPENTAHRLSCYVISAFLLLTHASSDTVLHHFSPFLLFFSIPSFLDFQDLALRTSLLASCCKLSLSLCLSTLFHASSSSSSSSYFLLCLLLLLLLLPFSLLAICSDVLIDVYLLASLPSGI